jgi:hypothetical protein
MMAETRQSSGITAQCHEYVPAGIRVVSSRLRSVNLERDSDTPDIEPVYVNARVLDIVSRFAAAIDDPTRTRAWSLTGPYGSGKSTIALLVGALLGPQSSRRLQAEKLLGDASPELARRMVAARDHLAPEGFITAITTARREAVTETLERALTRGVNRRWPDGRPPRRISASLKALREPGAGNAEALAALEDLCRESPVLLVIDEFGKILEHIASNQSAGSARDDVFVLQEIAEVGAGRSGLPLFTLTLQHLSFLDYAVNSGALQQREWAKIQGRFEDITFVPDLGDAVQLIRRSLSHEDLNHSGRELLFGHGVASTAAWSRLGLQGTLPADADLFSGLYPLHPLTATAAPLVATQVGQHDRSLTGFLASDEPYTVQRFITDYQAQVATTASTVRLPQLYDYFFASGRTTMLASANASRWIEIDLILSQAHGLDEQDLQILKTVAILNLIDASGALRAYSGTVLFALTNPVDDDDVTRGNLLARLENLAQRGFLVYREFSDEYRIWQGSDVDLRSRITEARARCDDHSVVKMLAGQLPAAVVAGRHSQRTGMLRHFITTATDPGTDALTGPDVNSPADGILIFHFGDEHDLPEIKSPLPVVIGTSKNARAVLDVGRDLIALDELLSAGDLDAVARREITERAGQTRAELAAAVVAAFSPGKPWARWLLLTAANDMSEAGDIDPAGHKVLDGQSLARIVSEACDHVYRQTPHIRNEMLGRHQLTSQGAKARRELITGMLTHPSRPFLGITGYGPERAIYDGVLAYLGLHRTVSSQGDLLDHAAECEFTEPEAGSTLAPAWVALRASIAGATKELSVDKLFRLLMAPPYGVKAGVVPVVIAASLIMGNDDIAIFEEGTYQPALTPDLMERLIKSPGRYTVKYSSAADGQRKLVLEKVLAALGMTYTITRPSPRRNPTLLAVTRELLNQVRSLSAYAASTGRFSERALAVRSALKAARDPDDLLFSALPQALGLPVVSVEGKCDDGMAFDFASRLADALTEIRSADDALRREVSVILAHEFRLPEEVSAMRETLAARAAAFAEQVTEPELRGFTSLALNDSLADDDWLDPVIVRLVHVGLASWNDSHLKQFQSAARRLASALDRLTHLSDPGISVARATATDGQVQLVSVTSHDGHEERVLVHIPSALREAASRLAAKVAVRADQQLGADGSRILLAMLAQSIAASHPPEQDGHPLDTDHLQA